jgi:hypothetical protein
MLARMPDLISLLDDFNRKERFFLIRYRLEGDKKLHPEADFRNALGGALGIHIPPDASWWMDYHLDWLYASLVIHQDGGIVDPKKVYQSPEPGGKNVNASQQDIDLLIAFEEQATPTHILLVEAKLDTSWTNKQFSSKVARLAQIFGHDGSRYPEVVPNFAIFSPKEPTKLLTLDLCPWMLNKDGKVPWVKLAPNRKWRQITRCNSGGLRSELGEYWRILK